MTDPSPLLQIPLELLLAIGHQIPGLPKDQQRDWLSLSLTCKELLPIGRELLLTNPLVNVKKVSQLIQAYFHFPDLARKARALEIVTPLRHSQLMRGWCAMRAKITPEDELDAQLMQSCEETIHGIKISSEERIRWTNDLTTTHRTRAAALISLLLAMLPNMKELHLGPTSLQYLEVIRRLGVGFPACYHHHVLAPLRPQLQILELPCHFAVIFECSDPENIAREMKRRRGRRGRALRRENDQGCIKDFLDFHQLRELTLPFEVLFDRDICGVYADTRDPNRTFPPFLEILRIVDAEQPREDDDDDDDTINTPLPKPMMARLLHGFTRHRADFPHLEQIEIYHYDPPVEEGSYKSFMEDAGREAQAVGVSVKLWFPRTHLPAVAACGQPWRYTDAELAEFAAKVEPGRLF